MQDSFIVHADDIANIRHAALLHLHKVVIFTIKEFRTKPTEKPRLCTSDAIAEIQASAHLMENAKKG